MADDKIPEMVERVAEALYVSEYPHDLWEEATRYWQASYRRHAAIAIAAMREPTKKIEDAAVDLLSSTTAIDWPDPDDLWRAMIAAALG
jgi:hypothetical protein